jgi:flagellin-like protein
VSNIKLDTVRPLADSALGERRGRYLQKKETKGGKRREMSAKTKRIERSQRFRRLRRGENKNKAVSPVVATLILILIAVAAAAALYLWLVAWQGNITGGIGQPSAQYTVTIGGSTSVYPFDTYAVTQFEQNNSDVVVSNNQGGSGAGMLSVCAGQVDIGTASALEALTTLEEPIASGGYGCQATPTPTEVTVAYDAVDVIVPTNNVHGLVSVSYDTMLTIYIANGGGLSAFTAAGQAAPSGYTYPQANGQATYITSASIAATGIVWDQIPAAVTGTVVGSTTQAVAAGSTWTAAACGTSLDDICYTTGGAVASTCGFTVCAGGSGVTTGTAAGQPGATIQQWGRADSSGTEQSFTARILGIKAGATTASLGYTGCGSDGQLASCGINPPTAQLGQGNPGVITGVGTHEDAIGFASDGLARASGSGVNFVALEAVGQSSAITPGIAGGSSSTIAEGINGNTVAGYQGWRPFEYWTLGTPTGEVARYINFVMDPANNQNFATEAAEVSVYSI